MGFSLGKAIGAIASPLTIGTALPFLGGGGGRPGTPNLPGAPNLKAPDLPNYPGLSAEEKALLQQRQNYLNQFQGIVSNYGQGAYNDASSGVANQELENYRNSLSGNIAPNQMLLQQKQKDWEMLKQRAGQLGIQLKGDSPESAASQSTAGNQMITDFNKRYGALEQNYNLGQQQFGAQQNLARLGLAQNAFGQQAAGYGQLGQTAQGIQQAYAEPRLGQFGVETNRATGGADIANQNALNQYNQQYGQAMANYNDSLAKYQNRNALLSGGLGLAGTIGGAIIGGPAGAMIGSQVGNYAGSVATGGAGGGQQSMGFNPMAYAGMGNQQGNGGSYVQNYQNLNGAPQGIFAPTTGNKLSIF